MTAAIQRAFAECLRAAGLEVEDVLADGLLHRCGTTDRPRRKDGAYKAFLDAPASIWWKNWRTGEEGTWTARPEKKLTAAQRKALRERIAAAKADARAEQDRRWNAAAKLAASIWNRARPAGDDHPYLKRKEVPAIGVRQTDDRRLIVPVSGQSGRVQSLQFILPEKPAEGTDKLFLKGGKTSGGFFSIPAKSGPKDGPLLIAEGYATAVSLHLATGYAVLIAFNAGNLDAVARTARRIHPDRELVLCADNDCETVRPDGTPWNPGTEAASSAARAVGGALAVCPTHEGKATDFNDLHRLRSLEAVRAVIAAARKQNTDCPMPEGFFLVPAGRRAGLYKLETKPDGELNEIRIGPPLAVKGMTRDSEGNEWGLMLEWSDPGADGQVRRVAQRFALCGLAGGLAAQMGILPADFDAPGCAEGCFQDWLAARGGIGASEDAAILAAVRLFIEQHGASRFQDLDAPMSTCVNRVGFRRTRNGMTEYLILPESFRAEVVKGYAETRAVRVLREAGWLRTPDKNRLKSQERLPGLGRVRVYIVRLPEDTDESPAQTLSD